MTRQYRQRIAAENSSTATEERELVPVKGIADSLLETYYDASPAIQRAMIRGYSGKARKIHVQKVQGSESTVVGPFFAGLLGPFTFRRGFDLILPEEAVEALRSANDNTTIFCDFNNADRVTGHVPTVEIPVEPRFPFMDFGEVPWEEYEAFCAKQRTMPNLPVNR